MRLYYFPVVARLCLLVCLLSGAANAESAAYLSHKLVGQSLEIITDQGPLTITAYSSNAFEVHYRPHSKSQLPSFALAGPPEKLDVQLIERAGQFEFLAGSLSAKIEQKPFRLQFYRDGELLLAEESGFFSYESLRGFRFHLQEGEKLIGGGQRVLGMDRRGHRLPLYNQAHYEYSTKSDQMYFGLPAVLSSRKYLLLFDNSARGAMDLGKSEPNVMQFEAVAGRSSYLVVSGATYPEILSNYTAITGRQTMPPRWVFGNFASRFGYHSEVEARDVVRRFRELDIPLDALVLDIFWFGPEIKGHMGKMDWDRNAFPTPLAMMKDFSAQGVKTVLVSEPFILSTSSRWQQAIDHNVLAKNPAGEAKRFDFYFGNTGLIDVFDKQAASWFWDIYRQLIEQGVAGVWGDLGEPEVHPQDTVHALGTADEIHNAYGHKWAELVYNNHLRDFPGRRPVILMRSGFAGSQRYGMIPWTGDVARNWGGLQSQLELALQMSLLGLAYTHSDLGGFAEGVEFNPELYMRWLQFGVFQPVFRPHGQEHIAPEPVFHDKDIQDRARRQVKLRYSLLPYVYTLAWENAISGMPLTRPLFFTDESDPALIDYKEAFLWGDAFLVSPVVAAGVTAQTVKLPEGVWFDFWRDNRYPGGSDTEIPVTEDAIPVLVRAGSFIPMTGDIATTQDYSSEQLNIHYYADSSVTSARGTMYEDDGASHRAYDKGQYELLQFSATQLDNKLTVSFTREGGGYKGMPEVRELKLSVHNWGKRPETLLIGGESVEMECQGLAISHCFEFDPRTKRLDVKFFWDTNPMSVQVQ